MHIPFLAKKCGNYRPKPNTHDTTRKMITWRLVS